MMYVKIHQSEHTEIVAVCDENLLGKTIKEGEKEIIISENFFKGELKKEKEVVEILKQSSNANLIGNESVECGLLAKIITEDNMLFCGGVKHAQFYSLE